MTEAAGYLRQADGTVKNVPVAEKKPEVRGRAKIDQRKLVLFRCHELGEFYGGIYWRDSDEWQAGFGLAPINLGAHMEHLCAVAGYPTQKPYEIASGEFTFKPGVTPQVTAKGNHVLVNYWREPKLRSKAVSSSDCPPVIRAVLKHVMGNDNECVERFLNWLAVIYQNNARTETAWVWTGVEGTGKGVIINEVLRPVFQYVAVQSVRDVASQFNGELERVQILNIDEAEIIGRDASTVESFLKMAITAPTLRLEQKYQAARTVSNYLNIILTSNKYVVGKLSATDRRFSIARSQDNPITSLFPDTDKLVKQLRSELPAFCGYLGSRDADRALARTPMRTNAKDQMTEASMTEPEAFARALKRGDLDWLMDAFADIADSNSIDVQKMGNVLSNWAEYASGEYDEPMRVPCAAVADCYRAIMGEKLALSNAAVGRFLGKQGVRSDCRTRGSRGESRGKAYAVTWRLKAPLSVDDWELLGRTGFVPVDDRWLD